MAAVLTAPVHPPRLRRVICYSLPIAKQNVSQSDRGCQSCWCFAFPEQLCKGTSSKKQCTGNSCNGIYIFYEYWFYFHSAFSVESSNLGYFPAIPPQSSAVLRSPPQSSAVLRSPPQSSAVLRSPPQSSAVLRSPPQSSAVLRSPPQSSEVLQCAPKAFKTMVSTQTFF